MSCRWPSRLHVSAWGSSARRFVSLTKQFLCFEVVSRWTWGWGGGGRERREQFLQRPEPCWGSCWRSFPPRRPCGGCCLDVPLSRGHSFAQQGGKGVWSPCCARSRQDPLPVSGWEVSRATWSGFHPQRGVSIATEAGFSCSSLGCCCSYTMLLYGSTRPEGGECTCMSPLPPQQRAKYFSLLPQRCTSCSPCCCFPFPCL